MARELRLRTALQIVPSGDFRGSVLFRGSPSGPASTASGPLSLAGFWVTFPCCQDQAPNNYIQFPLFRGSGRPDATQARSCSENPKITIQQICNRSELEGREATCPHGHGSKARTPSEHPNPH